MTGQVRVAGSLLYASSHFGRGDCGPTLAYWLGKYGMTPTLVERATTLRTGGYLIDFRGSGFEVAKRMGVAPQLLRAGCRVREVRVVNAGAVFDLVVGADGLHSRVRQPLIPLSVLPGEDVHSAAVRIDLADY